METISSELLRGSMDLMVLSVMADGPKYGYVIQQALRTASRDRINVQAGTLYPVLHRLEGKKLVRSRWDESTGRRRKWYELTKSGRAKLNQQAVAWQEYVECIKVLLKPVIEPGIQPA